MHKGMLAGLVCAPLLLVGEVAWAQHATGAFPTKEKYEQGLGFTGGDGPRLEPIVLSGDIVLRPEDVADGNYISPAVSASGRFRLTDGDADLVRAWLDASFVLQTPPTGSDTDSVLNRILSSGGVGELRLAPSFGIVGPKQHYGLVVGAHAAVNWELALIKESEDSDTTVSEQFWYVNYGVVAALWLRYFYVGANYVAGYAPLSDELGPVGAGLEDSDSFTVSFVARIGGGFVQLRWLPSAGASSEALEIRLVASFRPF